MKIYKKIYVIKNFLYFLSKKYLHFEKDIIKANLRKVAVHALKSDFIILFFIIININIIFYLKFLFGNKNNLFYSIFFPPFFKRFTEILLSITFLNNSKFKEKFQCKNYFSKSAYYEYIVLGSGPSGAINSYYLNQKFPGKVLLLEKGKHYSVFKTKHPHDEFIKKWQNGGLNSTIYPYQISFASGECLGGGSEINSGLFHKPSKEFLIKWKKKKFIIPSNNEIKINYQDLFQKIHSQKINTNSRSSEFFIKGCLKTGQNYQHIPQFYTISHNKKFKKNTMTNTYIEKFIKNNGEVQTGYSAQRILYDYKIKQWIITGIYNGIKKLYNCKNLFINCGAINTSKLLIKSDILKNKVSHFKFHPMIKVVVEFSKNVQNGHENVHPFQILDKNEEFIIGEAASGPQFIKINFINDKNLYLHSLKNWKKMAIYHCTFSMGIGKIKKVPFLDQFYYTYNIEEDKIQIVRKALLKLSKILFSGGAIKIYLTTTDGTKILKIDDYKLKISNIMRLGSLKFSSVHILGGISAGEEKDCLADSYGKIKNYNNLYVNDSSLISENLLRNPQGSIMLIAKRNIEQFIKNYQYDKK